MTIFKGKRPRDPNQLAKWIVDHSTSETPEPESVTAPVSPPSNLSEYMAEIGRRGGKIGGKMRLKTMSQSERKQIARKAAKTRWRKKSPR